MGMGSPGCWSFPELEGKYQVTDCIGEGTFSEVFEGIYLETSERVAIKRIRSTSRPSRTCNEVRILLALGEHAHVSKLLRYHRSGGDVSLVMQCGHNLSFRYYFASMSVPDIQLYFRSLFDALQYVHAQSIIHRDIKPNNILFSPQHQSFLLIDFGLAQRETTQPTEREPSRAGTRGFRAPEVLFKVAHQTNAIDVWSAGVILLCILSGRYPFFHSPDDLTALAELGALFGTEEMATVGRKFGKEVLFPHSYPAWNLQELCVKLHRRDLSDIPPEAFDLLERCLDLDPTTRISAAEALQHPFLKLDGDVEE